MNIRKGVWTSQDILDGLNDGSRMMGEKPQNFTELTKSRQKSLGEPFYKAFVTLFAPSDLKQSLPREQQDTIEGTYLFKVSLSRGRWRKIEMAAKHTLHKLHIAIQEAFAFDDDHLYCFFMDNKKWSYDRYESPLDEDGPYADEVMIGELELYPGKTFLYLFDYGDEWEFKVEVEEINSDKPLPLNPQIVDKLNRRLLETNFPRYPILKGCLGNSIFKTIMNACRSQLLHTLEQKDLLISYKETADNARVWKYYRITKKGRKHLHEKKEEWKTYTVAVNDLLGGAGFATV